LTLLVALTAGAGNGRGDDQPKTVLKSESFDKDPGWEGHNNHIVPKRVVTVKQDFGYSKTHFAGKAAGELGGQLTRASEPAYYADKIGALSLDDRLEANGKVVLKSGAPDSDMYLGWFNSASKDEPPSRAGHFLGVHVGGPTRVGHYFHPSLATANGTKSQAKTGPVLTPEKVYDWSVVYDPAAEGGKGAITVRLDKESVTLVLKKGIKAQGARFDRFGLFTSNIGGQIVRVYFDDLKYTSEARPHAGSSLPYSSRRR
jgi:hypothetical protein